MNIEPSDVQLDFYYWPERTQGGMYPCDTPKGVRITHIPTGMQVGSHNERSQFHNKRKALAALEILLELEP